MEPADVSGTVTIFDKAYERSTVFIASIVYSVFV